MNCTLLVESAIKYGDNAIIAIKNEVMPDLLINWVNQKLPLPVLENSRNIR